MVAKPKIKPAPALADTAAPAAEKPRYHIEAIQRGLDILALFGAETPNLSLAEISRLTESVPSTTLRIVNTLEDMGFVEQATAGVYRAGPAALQLGHAMVTGSALRLIAEPLLRRIRDQTGEAASLGVYGDGRMHFIDHAAQPGPLGIVIKVGARLPAFCTAAGKAVLAFADTATVTRTLGGDLPRLAPRTRTRPSDILAELPGIRAAGYAVQDEELMAGMRSIAAPILDEAGVAFAALTVAVAKSRYELAELQRDIAPVLVGAAAEASVRWRAKRALARPLPEGDPPAPVADADRRSRYHVEALSRGLSTLLTFAAGSPQLTLTEIARRTDTLMSTAFRVVTTLANLGYLRLDGATNAYELMPKCLTLGYDSLVWLDMRDLFQPPLARLHAAIGASVYLSILAGHEAVDILSFVQPGAMTTVGRSFPLYCTPGGKMWLAYMAPERAREILDGIDLIPRAPKTLTDRGRLEAELAAIREQGYSVVDEENLPGVGGIGVPVLAADGRCVAAVASTVPAGRLADPAERARLVQALRDAGQDLSNRLLWSFA